jgi:G:T-mismatch repair DNA endonuclease (very short patch repair protein)
LQRAQLSDMGWKYLDVWECQLLEDPDVIRHVEQFLE